MSNVKVASFINKAAKEKVTKFILSAANRFRSIKDFNLPLALVDMSENQTLKKQNYIGSARSNSKDEMSKSPKKNDGLAFNDLIMKKLKD